MLSILRKRAQSTVIQIVVLIIAIVFVFWGVGTNLGTQRNSLATVNGEDIPFDAFQRSYDNAVDNMRIQFGGTIPQGLLEGLGLNRQVLNQLIQAEILRQGGKEMGLMVSKLATQDEIKAMSVFQTDGQFDLNRYKSVLEQNRMNPSSFEAGLRNDLLTQKVSEAIQGFAVVPDNKITSRYNFTNEQIRLAFAAVKSEDLQAAVEVDDKDLAAWYEQHKNEYLPDPKIRLQYLFFGYDEDLDQIAVSDDVLKARYEAEREKYFQPEQRRARHILLRVTEQDDAQMRTDKKQKAEEILTQAKSGKDFAELAKLHSEDSSAKNGGDLGFFGKGAMVESFDNAVFQLKPGEVSDLVETVFGYHVIKLEEVREATTRSFEQVKAELADQVRRQDGKGLTFKRASLAYEDIFRAGSLAKYQEDHKEIVKETDFFSRNEPPAPPVSDPQFLQAAFGLKKGELSSIIETGQGYAILFVNDTQTPSPPELSTVREQVEAAYRKEKSVDLARTRAENLLQEARDKKSLSEAAPKEIAVQQSGQILRSNPASGGEVPAQVVQEAFALTLKDALPAQPLAIGDTFYVFQLLERGHGEESLDDAGKEQLRQQLLTAAENDVMADWLTWMQSRSKVWINEELLK
ncbi:MAG: SurA N-terminal domain-containing protein [Desulfobulbaceae bacterium]